MERSSTAPNNGARRTHRSRALAGSAIFAATLFIGGVAGAQTTVDPEAGGNSDQGTSDTGSQVGTPAPAASGTTDGGSLALTGGDVTGIALIGAAAAGAGGLLVLGSRRRRTEPVTA